MGEEVVVVVVVEVVVGDADAGGRVMVEPLSKNITALG